MNKTICVSHLSTIIMNKTITTYRKSYELELDVILAVILVVEIVRVEELEKKK